MTHSVDVDRLVLFDTTLRDGLQTPGARISDDDHLAIGLALEAAGVDVIEVGIASKPAVFARNQVLAQDSSRSVICALTRAIESEIHLAAESVKTAQDRARLHVFIATDPVHMRDKLRRSPQQVLQQAQESVRLAASLVPHVEASPEAATTSVYAYLCAVVRAMIEAGAKTINIPDTKGYCVGRQYGDLLRQLQVDVPELASVTLSAHCHNDHGLATSNTLDAICSGARQVECTVGGIGERAGNTALEEVLFAIHQHSDLFKVTHGFDLSRLHDLSTQVVSATGIVLQSHKAVVGKNAFTHESGIHQDGMIKNSHTYELCDPAIVGATSRLTQGPLSGRAGAAICD